MARVFTEGFEGTGYENSWAETVTGTASINEDATPTPSTWESECVRVVVSSAGDTAFAQHTLASTLPVSYHRFEILVESEGLADGQLCICYFVQGNGGTAAVFYVFQTSGVLAILSNIRHNAADNFDVFGPISLGTKYRVELKWDTTADTWEWWVDGVSQGSGTITGTAVTWAATQIAVGAVSSTGTATYQLDAVAIDDAAQVGPVTVTMAADPGAFTITGTAASLEHDRVLQAAPGAFTVTGTAASLQYNRVLAAEPGAFTITGTAATLVKGKVLAAEPGAFTITGTAADLTFARKLDAQPGAFTITGTDATLTYTQVGEPEEETFGGGGIVRPRDFELVSGLYTNRGRLRATAKPATASLFGRAVQPPEMIEAPQEAVLAPTPAFGRLACMAHAGTSAMGGSVGLGTEDFESVVTALQMGWEP